MYVPASDEIRVVFHEECQNQHADVHSVIIGIGCDYYVVVSQVVDVFLHSQCGDEKIQFLVLCHALPAFLVAVYRLAS